MEDKGRRKKERDRKKKKKKEKKKRKKRSKDDSASSADEDGESSKKHVWSVVCLTQSDWEDLAAKYKKSKRKCDRELYETLTENFLPEIVKMFAEREREERRRLVMLQPKRASSRIERKRQEQEEKDRLLAIKVGSSFVNLPTVPNRSCDRLLFNLIHDLTMKALKIV